MVYKAVFLALVAVTLCGLSKGYTDCGSVDGSIVNVTVSNCSPTDKRCVLKRNTNATMALTFTPKTDSDSLKAVVNGVILGVPIPFELSNPDGCKDSGIECPIKNSTTYTYITKLPILPSYPRVTVDIQWELRDDSGKNVICALIPAKIK